MHDDTMTLNINMIRLTCIFFSHAFAANGGTISTYTWICIVINFLQMRSPPILPALHDMPHTLSADNQVINGNNTSFCEDLSKLEGFGYANKETLGGLLYAFFRR